MQNIFNSIKIKFNVVIINDIRIEDHVLIESMSFWENTIYENNIYFGIWLKNFLLCGPIWEVENDV